MDAKKVINDIEAETITVVLSNGEYRSIFVGVEHLKMAFYAGVRHGRKAYVSTETTQSNEDFEDFVRSISHKCNAFGNV